MGVAVMAVLGVQWLVGPDVFGESAGAYGMQAQIGESQFIVGAVAEPRTPTRVRAIVPRDPTGSAARVEFHACKLKSGVGYGLYRGLLSDLCSAAQSVSNVIVQKGLPRSAWIVVLEVRLLEEGVFRMDGFEVTYGSGLLSRTEVTGSASTFYTEGNKPL